MSKVYLYDKNLNPEIKELFTLSTPGPSCESKNDRALLQSWRTND